MNRVVLILSLVGVSSCWGQLTSDQKLVDFQDLASLYAKQYAPYQWKMQAFGYSLFNLGSWLDRVRKSANDLEFYEIMAEYVASLNDAHSVYTNPSDFFADLRFRCDIYDGKVLIDDIDRTALPSDKYPFAIGDEVVMVDNRTTGDYIKDFSQFFSDANPGSTTRDAAGLIPIRIQQFDPMAETLADTATVVIRHAGSLQTYIVPWVKSGTPLSQNGPVPTPHKAGQHGQRAQQSVSSDPNRDPKPYLRALRYLQVMRLARKRMVLGFDALPPVFALPPSFQQRLGNGGDFFFTGTYKSGSRTIGYIRIPDFDLQGDFTNVDSAEVSFDIEIAYMQQNTDGLVVDVMRNPGGFGCYAEDLMSRLATKPFHGLNLELRPLIADVQAYAQAIQDAQAFGEPDWVVTVLKAFQAQVNKAYDQGGLTGQIPACGFGTSRAPNIDVTGKLAIYDKPVLLLTDEFSASAADFFAAMFQDAQRGKIFGMRTMGAGGSVSDGNPVGYYSEGLASVTQTLGVRAHPVITADYPAAPFIENIGVRPDIQSDYMTVSNLNNQGKDYVAAFTSAILTMIGK